MKQKREDEMRDIKKRSFYPLCLNKSSFFYKIIIFTLIFSLIVFPAFSAKPAKAVEPVTVTIATIFTVGAGLGIAGYLFKCLLSGELPECGLLLNAAIVSGVASLVTAFTGIGLPLGVSASAITAELGAGDIFQTYICNNYQTIVYAISPPLALINIVSNILQNSTNNEIQEFINKANGVEKPKPIEPNPKVSTASNSLAFKEGSLTTAFLMD
jgi:hypothetical protein